MPHVALAGGAYQARSLIAAAQRSLNLFAESVPQSSGEPTATGDLPTPGLRLLATLPEAPVRGIRQTTTGATYVVAGNGLYSVAADWSYTRLGSLQPGLLTPVSMADNGLQLVVVDGSAYGWRVTLATNHFELIVDTTGAFRGGTRADYLDTFFLFAVPDTPQFQSSLSLSTNFDTLYFANKQAYSDMLMSLVVAKRDIWLIGSRTTEIWYNSGAADFPFESMPGAFIDQGSCAKYSPASVDNQVLWLSQDRTGRGIVVRGTGYAATRVSTYAIEDAIARYPDITDAIGFVYQLSGHTFYVLTFPRADHTWAYDMTTGLWHEWLWIDSNGVEHRHRANCAWNVSGTVVVGDWQNGNLYALDTRAFSDAGHPIKRQRSFPHILEDGRRVSYRKLIADMQAGEGPADTAQPAVAPVSKIGMVSLTASAVFPEPGEQIGVNLVSGPGGGFGATLAGLTVSVWLCEAAPVYPGFQIVSGDEGDRGVVVQVTSWAVKVEIFQAPDSMGYWEFVVDPPLPPALVHVLLSFDPATQRVQVYVNDVSYAPSSDWVAQPVPGIANDARAWHAQLLPDEDTPSARVGIGDLWVTDAALDLSDTVVRRKFIAADGSPVSLGADGSAPTGTQPGVCLHMDITGDPITFPANLGTGDAWAIVNGPLSADTACATPGSSTGGSGVSERDARVFLDWSDDRGRSFGTPVGQTMGAVGEYRTSLQWLRLGTARDRVWRLTWSGANPTALQGAWIEATPAES